MAGGRRPSKPAGDPIKPGSLIVARVGRLVDVPVDVDPEPEDENNNVKPEVLNQKMKNERSCFSAVPSNEVSITIGFTSFSTIE